MRMNDMKKGAPGVRKLSDGELDIVSGGFMENGDYGAKGMNICCPVCGRAKQSDISVLSDNRESGFTGYTCACGSTFYVSGAENLYLNESEYADLLGTRGSQSRRSGI